jgi:uncharacterized damage-inducible protein DinB
MLSSNPMDFVSDGGRIMNPSDILKYGHLMVLDTINGLSEEQWTTEGVCGAWSCKDLIGHLAAYEKLLEDVLCTFTGSEPSEISIEMGTLGPMQFNDAQAELRKDKNVEEIIKEYSDTYTRVASLVAQITPETWRQTGTIPWYGEEYSLDDFIVYSNYGHKREHCAEINVFRTRLQTS